ncbi:MAG: hypothetical protein K0M47_09500, partial [Rhizobium sp.]|nr:hypothetical protein [Rhizobium sp.]
RSPTMSPPGNGLPANATTVALDGARTFAGEGATHYLGLRTASGPNSTVYGDDFSIKEAVAFPGFSTPAFAALIAFRTPASLPASAKVLFSFDDGGARNRYRAALNPDGTMTVVVDANGVNQISHVIAAGLVTLDAEHRLYVSSDGAARYLVALDDVNLYGQNAVFTPAGGCWVRLGASPTPGEEWTGEIRSAALFAHEYAPPRFLWAVGDSYVGQPPDGFDRHRRQRPCGAAGGNASGPRPSRLRAGSLGWRCERRVAGGGPGGFRADGLAGVAAHIHRLRPADQ